MTREALATPAEPVFSREAIDDALEGPSRRCNGCRRFGTKLSARQNQVGEITYLYTWCDEHAPDGATDLPRAPIVRWLNRAT